MSKEIIELDKPALRQYLNLPSGKSISVWSSNESYIRSNFIIGQATMDNPVYRVSVDYDIDGLKFNIGMITTETKIDKVNKFFDKLAVNISAMELEKLRRSGKSSNYIDERFKK